MNKKWWLGIAAIIIVFGAGLLIFNNSPRSNNAPLSTGTLQIIAAENFWGSLISQLGGSHVHVTSIVSDPNADPHEYESNAANARAFANADYVIVNGAGYDSWANKLLGASQNQNRKVLNVAAFLGKKEGDNPHFWYNPAYVNQTIFQIKQDLITLDPANASYYENQYQVLQASLVQYQDRIANIQQQFGGANVAATEDIFSYLADAAGLDLVSPPAFTQAVAEGNDPPASSIVEFENQLKNDGIKVLVYNQQTVTPLTESMKKIAADNNIPVVGFTETIQPPNASFEDWMNAQLIELQNALASRIPKQ
jgi:zinc/manganese transport system substrate-binding protein